MTRSPLRVDDLLLVIEAHDHTVVCMQINPTV